MDLALLDDRLAALGEPRFRARQVWAWTARGAGGYDAMTDLPAALRERLADTPGVTVHDVGRVQGGIVTFSLVGTPSADVAAALRGERVNVSVSPRSYSLVDFARRGLDDMVRASVHYYNDDEELDRLVAVVRALRNRSAQSIFS